MTASTEPPVPSTSSSTRPRASLEVLCFSRAGSALGPDPSDLTTTSKGGEGYHHKSTTQWSTHIASPIPTIAVASGINPYFHPAWFEPLSREMAEGAIAPYFSSCKPECLL